MILRSQLKVMMDRKALISGPAAAQAQAHAAQRLLSLPPGVFAGAGGGGRVAVAPHVSLSMPVRLHSLL